ncbi:MAG: restriction endonuclease subunit S [Treponema sp.]|nr:restriction endonuclease subunit S [Treponema sp.]
MQCNWKEYKLEDLLDYEQPGPYIVESTAYNDSYETPVLTPGKTFIIGKTNEKTGIYNKLPVIIFDDFTTSTQYVDFPFKVKSSAMKILTAKDELVIPKLIFYMMQSIHINTSTHKRQWLQTYSKLNVRIPEKKEDQQELLNEIEEMMSDLDEGISTLSKLNKQLKLYRYLAIQQAFKGNYSKTHKKIDVNLNWASDEEIKKLEKIPDEWRYIALSELGELGRGKSKHRPRNDKKLFENGKYPFIQTAEVKAAEKEITEYKKLYNDFGLAQSKLWKKGTLCITIAANIAETSFLGIDACFPDSVVGFTAGEHIHSKYIKYFIESQKLKLWAYAPATAQKNINLDTLENLIVPYSSYEEQEDIIEQIESRLTICDEIQKIVNETINKYEAIRFTILRKKFKEGK